MKSRCYNKNNYSYEYYGGRGITVCDEWLGENGFINFYNWAMTNGYADNLTIDRIDTNGNYEPNNCRWVTMLQQSNNTRANRNFEYNGEVHTLKEWANLFKINYNTLFSRIDVLGWDFKKAISEPVQEQKKTRSAGRKGRYIEYNGEIHNIAEWSNVTGIGKKTISYRIKNGYPLDKVFGKNDLRSTGCEICVKEYKKI